MNKKITSEPVTSNEHPESSIQVPSITDHLITALCKMYQPSGEPETMELKSTIDIVEEMQSIADVDKWEIQIALQKLGFEIKSTDAGYYWIMYKV